MAAETIDEFKAAAHARLLSAAKLRDAAPQDLKHLASACYLAGYSVEMLLKAGLMKVNNKKRFSQFRESDESKPACPNCGQRVRCAQCQHKLKSREHNPYRSHELHKLMDILGKYGLFADAIAPYRKSFTNWDATRRYDASWLTSVNQGVKFIAAAKDFYIAMRGGLK